MLEHLLFVVLIFSYFLLKTILTLIVSNLTANKIMIFCLDLLEARNIREAVEILTGY